MNRDEALKTLNLPSSSSSIDEAKVKFKKLAFEKHPDRNKDNPNAEVEFKKISEAYNCLINPQPKQHQQYARPGWNVSSQRIHINHNINNSFFVTIPKPIEVNINLTFKESVLGIKKKLKIERLVPCAECKGQTSVVSKDKCPHCQGKGSVEKGISNGNQFVKINTLCSCCRGTGLKHDKCNDCNGEGTKSEKKELDIKIPGGVINGHVIRLHGGGSVSVQGARIVQGDVFLIAKVERVINMTISGQDVISTIDISLSEAIKGATKTVKTVLGDVDILINQGARHKDRIKISGYGVEKRGNHVFSLNVIYPKDLDGLAKFLTKE